MVCRLTPVNFIMIMLSALRARWPEVSEFGSCQSRMPRGEQLLRQWNLLRTLQTRGRGLSLRELAGELDVSERTVQRDLELLEELGFPLEYDEDPFGKRFWHIPHDFFRTGPLTLSLTEALSLHLAQRFFAPLTGTYFMEGLQAVLGKIRSLLPATALEHFRELDDILHVRLGPVTDYSGHADTIRLLLDAARQQTTVEIEYRSVWRGETYTTRVDPYGLVYYEGDLFLVGHSHRAAATRVFKVTRIATARLSDQTFTRPADFDLDQHFRASFGIFQSTAEPVDVTVRFRGPVAALVEERVWHESQKLERLPPEATLFDVQSDQPKELIGHFRLANLVEFKRWLKGLGQYAEVLRPASLRDELREELLAAARQYGGDDST
jgi:predicted DNA-binding transcriptional regulator YafY